MRERLSVVLIFLFGSHFHLEQVPLFRISEKYSKFVTIVKKWTQSIYKTKKEDGNSLT